ncbi:lyase [Erythrobacter colymbi]|uniref:lyase n=1 Tax=Erythrobacter colymbi TaxID=1161202 RepID=UPI001180AE94|nr:lyase [Erythrobacter colymbi]
MDDDYLPSSDFLCSIANGQVPLSGSNFAEQNLMLLISLTRDNDVSNRDWATMLLAMQEIDTPAVRSALLFAAEDTDSSVRAEALEGLAMRDKNLVLPLIERELSGEECALGTFEAARLAAHPSLLPRLRNWKSISTLGPHMLASISDAIAACEASLDK